MEHPLNTYFLTINPNKNQTHSTSLSPDPGGSFITTCKRPHYYHPDSLLLKLIKYIIRDTRQPNTAHPKKATKMDETTRTRSGGPGQKREQAPVKASVSGGGSVDITQGRCADTASDASGNQSSASNTSTRPELEPFLSLNGAPAAKTLPFPARATACPNQSYESSSP